jgi:hypothetical protein
MREVKSSKDYTKMKKELEEAGFRLEIIKEEKDKFILSVQYNNKEMKKEKAEEKANEIVKKYTRETFVFR